MPCRFHMSSGADSIRQPISYKVGSIFRATLFNTNLVLPRIPLRQGARRATNHDSRRTGRSPTDQHGRAHDLPRSAPPVQCPVARPALSATTGVAASRSTPRRSSLTVRPLGPRSALPDMDQTPRCERYTASYPFRSHCPSPVHSTGLGYDQLRDDLRSDLASMTTELQPIPRAANHSRPSSFRCDRAPAEWRHRRCTCHRGVGSRDTVVVTDWTLEFQPLHTQTAHFRLQIWGFVWQRDTEKIQKTLKTYRSKVSKFISSRLPGYSGRTPKIPHRK